MCIDNEMFTRESHVFIVYQRQCTVVHVVDVNTHMILPGEHVVVVNTQIELPGELVVVVNTHMLLPIVRVVVVNTHKILPD